ncbi:MAG: alpha/beta fold hydrolase [Phycisphaerales bacterium JB052]
MPQIAEQPWWLDPFESTISLGERVMRAGVRYAGRRAIQLADGSWLTHGDLHTKAAPVRQAIARSVAERGGAVGCLTQTNETLTIALIAMTTSADSICFLDPSVPAARNRQSLNTIGARTLLADHSTAAYARSVSQPGDKIILVDEPDPALSIEQVPVPHEGVLTIFTSGSTGQAKGVLRPYLAMAHTAYNLSWRYQSTPDDVMMYTGSPGHVGTLNDVLLSILNGFAAVAVQTATVDLKTMYRKINQLGITKVAMPPSLMRLLLLHASVNNGFQREILIGSSGEALLRSDVRLFFDVVGPNGTLWQSYGSTEAGHMIAGRYGPEHGEGNGPLPLNSPSRGVEIEILGEDGQLIEPGQSGLIRVRTPALALGYTSPANEQPTGFGEDAHGRYFMTGDRAKLIEPGVFVIEGRADRQINLNGQRVELGEIESAILGTPGWGEACAALVSDSSGRKVLMAMVSPSTSSTQDVESLRERLREHLPTFAIPAQLVTTPSLPRTTTGKTDLTAVQASLEQALRSTMTRGGTPPRGSTENWVADAWQTVLGIDERPNRDVPFDQFGGDSLNAVELCLRFGEKFGAELSMDFVTANRTVAAQADALQRTAKGGVHTQRLVPLRSDGKGPICILVPGAGGHAWVYLGIANAIRCDCDLFALNLNFTTEDELHADRLTKSILDAMDACDHARPVLFVGYSRGTLIASTLAESCRKAGMNIEGIALIDPSPLTPASAKKLLKEAMRSVVRSVRERATEAEACRLLDEQINATRREIARLYRPERTRLPDMPCSILCTTRTQEALRALKKVFKRPLAEIDVECIEGHSHLDLMRKRGAPVVADWLTQRMCQLNTKSD